MEEDKSVDEKIAELKEYIDQQIEELEELIKNNTLLFLD